MERTLKFNRNCEVGGVLTYEADKTYTIDDSRGSASRWLTRGFAEEVVAYDPGHQDVNIIDREAGETEPAIVEIVVDSEGLVETAVDDSVEVAIDPLDILGGDAEEVDAPVVTEEVANLEVKAQNGKGRKSKKGN